MHPTSFAATHHEPRFTQRLEVEGEQGLAEVDRLLEVTDTLLARLQVREDGEPAWIRERMEQGCLALEPRRAQLSGVGRIRAIHSVGGGGVFTYGEYVGHTYQYI